MAASLDILQALIDYAARKKIEKCNVRWRT
jgi:hypothetical protein